MMLGGGGWVRGMGGGGRGHMRYDVHMDGFIGFQLHSTICNLNNYYCVGLICNWVEHK